jgi:hypothetical protein
MFSSLRAKKTVATLFMAIIAIGMFAPVGASLIEEPAFFSQIAYAQSVEDPGKLTEIACGLTNITGCVANITYVILKFFAWLVGGAGVILNKAADATVLKMGTTVNALEQGALGEGWRTFRDLANIVLIFALLAIGIATILGNSSYHAKSLLIRLIIVALLLNFSLFFTELIIDAGNLLAAQFYYAVFPAADSLGAQGISNLFMDSLSLQTLYNYNPQSGTISVATAGIEPGLIIAICLMGWVLFAVTAFVFLAAAVLLVMRFVVLLFLMVFSPLAFVAMVLPRTSSLAQKWWSELFNQVMFAPAYFLLTWFSIKVFQSDAFKASIGLGDTKSLAAVATGDISSFAVFLNFLIVITFMVFSLLIAKYFGVWGANTMIGMGKNLRNVGTSMVGGAVLGGAGFAARNVIGRGASALASSEKLKSVEAKAGILGGAASFTRRRFEGVAGSSMDVRNAPGLGTLSKQLNLGKAGGKGGYEAQLKQQVKQREETYKNVGKVTMTDEERTDVRAVQTDIDAANRQVQAATARQKAAVTPEEKKAASEQLKAAQDYQRDSRSKVEKVEGVVKERGDSRQREYLENLETKQSAIRKVVGKVVDVGVPRPNKEAADKIRASKKQSPKERVWKAITDEVKENPDMKNEILGETPPPETAGGSATEGEKPATA